MSAPTYRGFAWTEWRRATPPDYAPSFVRQGKTAFRFGVRMSESDALKSFDQHVRIWEAGQARIGKTDHVFSLNELLTEI